MNTKFSIHQSEIKEAAKAACARAAELNLPVTYQQALELVSASFGFKNYHQVAPVANGGLPIQIGGLAQQVDIYQAIDSFVDGLGENAQLDVLVKAGSSCGEVSVCEFCFDRDDLRSLAKWVYHGASESTVRFGVSFHDSEYMRYEEGLAEQEKGFDQNVIYVLKASSVGKHGGGRAWTECDLNAKDLLEQLVVPAGLGINGSNPHKTPFLTVEQAFDPSMSHWELQWAQGLVDEFEPKNCFVMRF